MDWLPTADKDVHGGAGSWAETTDPKCCIHTTESPGWPSYNGWSVNPHATIKAIPNKGIDIRQHLPFSGSSFALRNLDGGVQTNRDYVFQFELVGTSEKSSGYYYWPEADDVVLLAFYDRVVVPMHEGRNVPIKALNFQSYPKSYGARGATNTVRLSGSTFDNYSGWLGHQHVPENAHGDPGNFPWDRMMQLVEERDMPLTDAEIEKIAKKVWDLDYVPNQEDSTPSTNPTYAGKNAVATNWKRTLELKDAVASLRAQVVTVQVDNAALKSAVAALQSVILSLREEVRTSHNTVVQAVSDAIANSLATSTVQVDVNVNGKVTP